MEKTTKKKKSVFDGFLNAIERVGNKLPHPITLFAILALIVIVLSALLSALGVSATGELVNSSAGTMEMQTVTVQSLLTRDGFVFMLTKAISNFTSYAPLGIVLVAMLGVGVAESSGFITAAMKRVVAVTPRSLITPVIIFLGVMSNIASDVGYIVLVPLAATMFMAYGRHPLVGIAAAFAGVSGGFSANLLIGTLDPLMSGISNEAVKLINPAYVVEPTGNMFFMMPSVFLITILGTIITEKVVEPRLGAYKGRLSGTANEDITPVEKKALKAATWTLLAMVAVVVILCIPQNSIFRGPEGNLLGKSPLIQGVIVLVMLFFLVPSVVFGFVSGAYKSDKDVCAALAKSMAHMASYIALAFVAAQFINYFNYSKLGTILALNGASMFKQMGIGPIPLTILFVLFSAFLNLFMGSASAKWAILAPVFVPMFMLLGYTPEYAQVAFRIGDSCTNIITPMMSFFAMIVVFVQDYDEDAGMGTLTSMMLPYCITFLIGWTLMLIAWIVFDLPVGPGVGIFLA